VSHVTLTAQIEYDDAEPWSEPALINLRLTRKPGNPGLVYACAMNTLSTAGTPLDELVQFICDCQARGVE
jgi:hypothetical protein